VDTVLIAGLGNPGAEYEQTRHNLGFRVADRLCDSLGCRWKAGKGDFVYAEARVADARAILLKPLTYMNNSGTAVLDAVERFSVPLPGTLVVLDDAALPLGAIRIRPGGSDGGHHGLSSVIYHLQADEFPRLRCGIGKEGGLQGFSLAEYVLSVFEPGEAETVTAMIARAAEAAAEFAAAGIESAMNKFNS
jgi:PTH1 family peptidyl-tRNA hydrolase